MLLTEVYQSASHTDTILYCDGRSVAVHSTIISNCSELLRNLLASSESKVIILPSFSPVLADFVSLVYTGHAANLSDQDTELLSSLCTELGMTTTSAVDEENEHKGKKYEFLKLETDFDSKSGERFHLRLPVSRIAHRSGHAANCGHKFEGFKGRIQEEYNCSPIGPYEGPYDQDPQIALFAQLSKSKLDYDKYTNFSHQENMQCKIFQIKPKHEYFGDLEKIEALEIVENSTDTFVKPDDNHKVFYTCSKKSCVIPCPCNPCNSCEGQCPEHKIIHMDLFDEKEHAISIRSTELSCLNENFFTFSRSYTNIQAFLKNVQGVGKIFYTTKVITWIFIGPASFASCISTNFTLKLLRNYMIEKPKRNPGTNQFALIVILNFLNHIKERNTLSLSISTTKLDVMSVLNCSSACNH